MGLKLNCLTGWFVRKCFYKLCFICFTMIYFSSHIFLINLLFHPELEKFFLGIKGLLSVASISLIIYHASPEEIASASPEEIARLNSKHDRYA